MSRDTGDNLDRNQSGNLPMANVMDAYLSRRSVMRGSSDRDTLPSPRTRTCSPPVSVLVQPCRRLRRPPSITTRLPSTRTVGAGSRPAGEIET